MIYLLVRHTVLFVLPVAALAACANGAEASGERVSLYKSDGAVQCGNPGAPLAGTERQLRAAGIALLAARCGSDGRAHLAVCGSATGSIHIVEVPRAQAKAAQALGFTPLSGLPDATPTACK